MSEPQICVVSWIRDNARSRGVAALLQGQAEFMAWARPGGSSLGKVGEWVRSALRTVQIILRLPRGSLVVVMSPPVFAPLVALAAGRARGLRVAIDAHSGAFNDERWRWSFGLMTWLARRSDALIVTNTDLIAAVDVGSALIVVMHDPLNEATVLNAALPPAILPRVLFPASGADDEPFEAVAEVARRLAGEVEIVVTGSRTPDVLVRSGVTTTGFLPRSEYLAWLRSADVVLALTTRPSTMQRAAYEAAEFGRALVCSDTKVFRDVFAPMAELADNDADSIEAAIRRALSNRDQLAAGAVAVAATLRRTEEQAVDRLRELVSR